MNFSADQMGIAETGKDGRERVFVGKGDAPRNCQSDSFRDNYDEIDWGHDDDKG
jgi:hypothetical protein